MLTDLEGAVLGLIARDGPTTSYRLSREFASSPSQFWSGSSGAIYPLMARLRQRQLVQGEPDATGRRKATRFDITAEGRRALESWLTDADRAADMGFDPLRTRLIFLHLVSSEQRERLFADIARRIGDLAARNEAEDHGTAGEPVSDWLKMRLAWLRSLRHRARKQDG